MKEIKCNEVGTLEGGAFQGQLEQQKRVYGTDGLSPTLTASSDGGGNGVKILEETAQGENREPLVLDEQNGYIRQDGTVGTITTDGSSPKHNNRIIETEPINFRIRKLTPKEYWRLMDFDDEDFEKAQKVNSNAQLYKQAGNSIVVSCLYHIFRELL